MRIKIDNKVVIEDSKLKNLNDTTYMNINLIRSLLNISENIKRQYSHVNTIEIEIEDS